MASVLRHLALLRSRSLVAQAVARTEALAPHHHALGQPVMPGADWSWRPAPWSEPLTHPDWPSVPQQAQLASEVTIHHDGAPLTVSLRQTGPVAAPAAPFGLRVDLAGFQGSYLSVAIAFPPFAALGLRRSHVVRLAVMAETDLSNIVYTRLNIRHGPNVEQIVRRLPETSDREIDFDLGHADVTEARIAEAWVDVIFERPSQGSVLLQDVIVSRRARAAL